MSKTRKEERIPYSEMTPTQKRAAKAGNAAALSRRRKKDAEQKKGNVLKSTKQVNSK